MRPHFISLIVVAGLLAASPAMAGFTDDSTAALSFRNFYFDRDFRSGAGQSQVQEWAQGFLLDMQSGYTDGTLGFGMDLQGTAGIRLDSGPGRRGTGLLPYDPASDEPVSNYSELGLTAKLRYSATELKLGTLTPTLPVILAIPSRLFAPTFRGAQLLSRDVERLTVHAGQVNRINLRDSTNMQRMAISNPHGRFRTGAESDRFQFAGVEYQWPDSLTTSYFHGRLKDLYRQDYLGLLHTLPLENGSLTTDVRYFNSRQDGAGYAGPVDNWNLGAAVILRQQAHVFRLGYMQQNGETAMPYLAGNDVAVHTEGAMVSEYVNPKERTTLVRYDYDFTDLGVPGLTTMVRYIHGENIDLPQFDYRGKERESNVELAYQLQSGNLKGLTLRFRHASYRSDFARDVDETRVNVDYTLVLW